MPKNMMEPRIIHHVTLSQLGIECLHETAILWTIDLFARKGEVKPTWVIPRGEDLVWLETDWGHSDEKHLVVFNFMPSLFRQWGVTCYSLISEAWVAAYEHVDKDVDPADLPKPSSLPRDQRDEVLIIASGDIHDRQLLTRYLITPRRSGLPLLGPRMDEDLRVSGNLTGLFKRSQLDAWVQAVIEGLDRNEYEIDDRR